MTADITGGIATGALASDRLRRLARAALVAGAVVGVVLGVWFGLSTITLDLPDVMASFPAAPYAIDGQRHLQVANLVAAGGDAYSIGAFYYPPLGALLAIPFASIGADAGLWAWFAVKVAIV